MVVIYFLKLGLKRVGSYLLILMIQGFTLFIFFIVMQVTSLELEAFLVAEDTEDKLMSFLALPAEIDHSNLSLLHLKKDHLP